MHGAWEANANDVKKGLTESALERGTFDFTIVSHVGCLKYYDKLRVEKGFAREKCKTVDPNWVVCFKWRKPFRDNCSYAHNPLSVRGKE